MPFPRDCVLVVIYSQDKSAGDEPEIRERNFDETAVL